MIKAILIINNYGKPRLVKFYQSVTSEDAQQSVIRRVFQQVLTTTTTITTITTIIIITTPTKITNTNTNNNNNKFKVAQRPDSFCNYLEGSIPEWGDATKIIYRHYATLYFVFAVDAQESDLGILDLIQVFVEALDKCFENVCELDLIFHSDKINYILDEIIMAGMVLETNINHILTSVNEQNKLHAASIKMLPSSQAASAVAKDAAGKLLSTISSGLSR
jgi:AP-3 complex subunit sigma